MKPTPFPVISFLIPAYNHAAFISTALDSVLEDKYPNKEVIILDDGSIDGTDQIVTEWISRYGARLDVRYIQQTNKGVTKTLNDLVRLSKGQYFRVLASDDLVLPNGTVRLFSALQKNPDKAAVAADCEVIDKFGNQIMDSVIRMNGGNPEKMTTLKGLCHQIINHWSFSGPAILIEREYFSSIGLYNEDSTVEDWDTYLRLLADQKLIAIPDKVARYRLHDSNTSRTRDIAKRLRNQNSQLQASLDHADRFSGKMKILLLSKQLLLKTKIHYLSGRYFRAVGTMGLYFFYRALAFVIP